MKSKTNPKQLLFSLIVVLLLGTGEVSGQHSDIELGYDDVANPTMVVIDGSAFTAEGIPLYESEMVALDPFNPSDLGADDPGFATNSVENLIVNTGDQLWLQVVDATAASSAGVGYVNFYNPATDALEVAGRIAVQDNSISTDDLILNGSTIESGPDLQYIDVGNSTGTIHDHVIFDLLDDATSATGAYGIMFQLQADIAPTDGVMDVSSEPFWIVFNHGMSTADFDNLAIPKFGEAISVIEPSAFSVVHGSYVSGGLPELAGSDNQDVQARRRPTDIQSRVTVAVEGVSPGGTPASLEFTFEGSVFARASVTQIIEFFNYNTSAWEQVDSRAASRTGDAVTTVVATGDLSRFVEPGTGLMEARVRLTAAVQRAQFQANIDQMIWTIGN